MYYRREYIDKYRCIDYPIVGFVINDVPAFKQGDLFYFKKDNFSYLVLSKGNDGNYYIGGIIYLYKAMRTIIIKE